MLRLGVFFNSKDYFLTEVQYFFFVFSDDYDYGISDYTPQIPINQGSAYIFNIN